MQQGSLIRNWLWAVLLVAGETASARVLQAEIGRIVTPAATLEAVTLHLHWPDNAGSGMLEVRVKTLDMAQAGYRFKNVRWTCPLRRKQADWKCRGEIGAQDTGSASLSLGIDADKVEAALKRGTARAAVNIPRDDRPLAIDAVRVPVTWLKPWLATVWPEASLGAGTLDAGLTLDLSAPAMHLSGALTVAGLGLDTQNGQLAASGFNAKGEIDLSLTNETRATMKFTLGGGELLLGPLYAVLPAQPIEFGLTLTDRNSQWEIGHFRWSDAGALQLEGSARFNPDIKDNPLTMLSISASLPDLGLAKQRYFDTLLASAGLPGLKIDGRLEAQAEVTGGAVQKVDVHTEALSAVDSRGRFAIRDGNGEIGWTATATPVSSAYQWQSAALYGIDLGATEISATSRDRELTLAKPATISLLDGQLKIDRLAWTPPAKNEDSANLELALTLDHLSLAALGRALGWPAFEGTLSGRIPGVRYDAGVLALEGGLTLQMFDGRVEVNALTLERPFGVAPTLSADIGIAGLALQPLTQAFGFGEITGRLDGHIGGLRLVDWEPVAFDARFHTASRPGEKRRISQRAVRDLSEVGGSGLVAGIQQQVLRVFQTFAYDRIALSCRLENNVCHMGGIDGGNGGYTIVQGSGLPRITVAGFQRRVDWPVLLARLKTATQGRGPVVK